MNTFGRLFRLTTFGESHGTAIGGVLDGCPAGLKIDRSKVSYWLAWRASKGGLSTPRQEHDEVEYLSGLNQEFVTTGAPIAFLIHNKSVRSGDYVPLSNLYRPSHADYTYAQKYGIPPTPGGGRASARETAVRVVAGAIAMQFLEQFGVSICSYTASIGQSMELPYLDECDEGAVSLSKTGAPDLASDDHFCQLLLKAQKEGETLGGTVRTIVQGIPAGWGEPLYDKLHARLSYALLSINAARAFEMGDGIGLSRLKGSEGNDPFTTTESRVTTLTNNCGGVQGGISNGVTLRMRTFFKPISSHKKPQETVSLDDQKVVFRVTGRHDVSVFPRVLPVCDAMVALTLADFALLAQVSSPIK